MTSLEHYHQKRRFSHTPEPKGKRLKKLHSNHHFVVQLHAASHLHYDFRLEYKGVLKSWAIPKGPTLDPTIKRLAIEVEDHPLEYKDFEGIIPQGEYGGGTVMIWDQGVWEEVDNVKELENSNVITFILHGEKLKGKWKLIRIKNGKNWLLIKAKDEQAYSQDKYNIVEEKTLSVVSGRTLNEIKCAADIEGSSKIKKNPPASLLTHPNKVMYPKWKIVKQDIANYYNEIQDWILPYVRNRPLSIVRCPEGLNGECFYQKHLPHVKSKELKAIVIQEKSKMANMPYLDSIEGLIELVQINALELHPWSARIDNIEKPDYLTFDLDPGEGVIWKEMVRAAFHIKEEFETLGLQTFVKTTGGKGLHIVIPIQRRYDWETTGNFAQAFARHLVLKYPEYYIDNMSKAKRKGKIFIDYLRNRRGATAIAAYSLRANEMASISTPLAWEELSPKITSAHFTIKNIVKRLHKIAQDPWADFYALKQKLPGSDNFN